MLCMLWGTGLRAISFVCALPQPPCSEAASVAGAKHLLPQPALGKPRWSMGLAAENGARL